MPTSGAEASHKSKKKSTQSPPFGVACGKAETMKWKCPPITALVMNQDKAETKSEAPTAAQIKMVRRMCFLQENMRTTTATTTVYKATTNRSSFSNVLQPMAASPRLASAAPRPPKTAAKITMMPSKPKYATMAAARPTSKPTKRAIGVWRVVGQTSVKSLSPMTKPRPKTRTTRVHWKAVSPSNTKYAPMMQTTITTMDWRLPLRIW
mmetsp:Transcript_101761/g.294504  ORF Transcript_101761/g.294504 Transcript_101761/m.294504 type:complete len:208 (-) Transcript_101761:200-823(-)